MDEGKLSLGWRREAIAFLVDHHPVIRSDIDAPRCCNCVASVLQTDLKRNHSCLRHTHFLVKVCKDIGNDDPTQMTRFLVTGH